MGSNHKPQALLMYASVVPVDLEQACFECTASYLASRGDRNGGYNPENFLRDQAKDLFTARWPPWKLPFDKNQRRRDNVNQLTKALLKHRLRKRATSSAVEPAAVTTPIVARPAAGGSRAKTSARGASARRRT